MSVLLRQAAIALLVAACGSTSAADNPCPQGVCGDPPSGAGTLPDGGTAGPGAGPSGAGACVPSWTCTPWSTTGGNAASRTCTDANACGTGTPPVASAQLPALNEPYFECNVYPVLQRKCSQLGCHGTEQGRALRLYARGRLRKKGETLSNTTCPPRTPVSSDTCSGSIECGCFTARTTASEKQANFDAARGFALDDSGGILPDPTLSDLLAQPVVGGKAHAGVHLFGAADPDYIAIKSWLAGASIASCTPPYN